MPSSESCWFAEARGQIALDAARMRGYSHLVMAGGSANRAGRLPDLAAEAGDADRGDGADESATAAAPASTSGANRRSAQRVDVTWSVDCSTEDTFLYASIANISAIGIFVRTESPLEPGTELTLRFSPRTGPALAARDVAPDSNHILGDGDELVLRGLVQWVNHVRPGGDNPNPGMGIRFVDLAPAERERLVEAVRSIAYLREEAAAN